MKKLVLKYALAVGFTGLTFVACGGGSASNETPKSDFDVAPFVSECGGLGMATGTKAPSPDPVTYCDAEHLFWQYNAELKTIGLTNSRVILNCCGDHSVELTRDGETVVFTETDAPKASTGGARCKCNCVFDFAAVAAPIEPGITSWRIVRNVTDAQPATTIVWEGTLDLSAGAGQVVVSTSSADPWCTPPVP